MGLKLYANEGQFLMLPLWLHCTGILLWGSVCWCPWGADTLGVLCPGVLVPLGCWYPWVLVPLDAGSLGVLVLLGGLPDSHTF